MADAAIPSEHEGHGRAAAIGRALGPAIGIAVAALTHPAAGAHGGLTGHGALTLGLLAWMACWWLTHAVDVAVAALLPVVFLPILGISTFTEVAASYADNVIFLFAGGTVIGLALERHGVSSHFVHWLLTLAGTRPWAVVAALFMSAWSVSAFVSNTATTAMLLPLATGVAANAAARTGTGPAGERAVRNFTAAALLAIAYGSTVGGGATLIGSPPNAVAANFLRAQGEEIDFATWARVGVPIAACVAPLAIAVILRMLPVRGVELPRPRRDRLPPLGWAGWTTLAVFAAAVLVWSTATSWPAGWKPAGLTDGGTAIAAAVVLMVLPARDGSGGPVVPWSAARSLPWGVFVLSGGGLAIGEAMQRTGVSLAIGQAFSGLGALPQPVLVGTIVVALVFASEIGSNTALAATAIPVLAAAGPALGLSPQKVAFATAFGASYAFMLPVGTPPNAMVYGTGRVPHRAMIRVGFALNVSIAVVVTAAICALC